MANSMDTDRTAPLGTVPSWSAMFAHTYDLPQNLEY